MKSYSAPEAGQPLEEVESPTPQPNGSEVIIKTIACGVCHSDVHIHSGAFDLGGGNQLPLPLPNPFTLGHEVFGEVKNSFGCSTHPHNTYIIVRTLGPRSEKHAEVRLYPGSRIAELAARGTELGAWCLGLEPCACYLEQLGA